MYALAPYSSLRRTKEVGIRKTFGASVNSIVLLLSWDFVKPVLISCLLAWPLAYLAIGRFYDRFTSKAEFSIMYYLVVTAGVIGVALITGVLQCFTAAKADPVRSLRYE